MASLTHKRNRHHAAIILQSSCKDCSTLLLQACFCSYPCAIILQAVICIHMLWNANVYIYIYSVMEPCIHVCTTTFTEINLSFFRVPLAPEVNIVCKSAWCWKVWIALFGSLHFNIKLWGEGRPRKLKLISVMVVRIKRFLATRLNFNYCGRHNTSAPCCAHGAHATRISVVILVRCRPHVCGSGAS